MARSTFKVLFYVNGNKEKNDIARHRVVCPCNGTFLKALCSILVSQLLSYPVKFRTFALSHLSLRRIALT